MVLISELQKEVSYLGFSGEFRTLPDFFNWIRRAVLLFTPEKLKYSSQTKDSLIGKDSRFLDITEVMEGTFGKLYLSYMDSGFYSGHVFIKTSKKYQQSLLVEGLLQSCAYSVLKQYGFYQGVPRILKIVNSPDHGTSLVIQQIPGAKLFAEYLKTHFQWGEENEANDRLVLSIIVQVATFMAILEHELGMNHRDLKGTNVLMVTPVQTFTRTIQIGPHIWSFQSTIEVSIIDFGFSCIGNSAGKTVLSAGDFLPETDFCPKQGRDLFLFFASLWSVEDFRNSLTQPCKDLFHKWLCDSNEKSWADWLKMSLENNMLSMYLLCNTNNFLSPPCTPIRVLQDIYTVAPDLLSIVTIQRPGTPIPDL